MQHLTKWDWLEQEYHQKCHAADVAQRSLEKAEKNLKARDELLALKSQRIAELERRLDAASIAEEKVSLHE